VPGQDGAEPGDEAGRVQARAAGQRRSQGILAEQEAVMTGNPAGAGVGGAVGVQQQDITGGEPEADVGELDIGVEAEQAAGLAHFPHPAVRTADQGRRVARGTQPARDAAGDGAEGGVHGGEEPLPAALVEHRPVQVLQHHGGREMLGGLGTQGVTGQGGDLGRFSAFAAHIAHHRAPPRAPGLEQVVEVADHGGAARGGQVRRGGLQAGHRRQDRGQQAVLQAAGQCGGGRQRRLGDSERVLRSGQRGAQVDLVAHRPGHGGQRGQLLRLPRVRMLVDHAHAAEHVPVRGQQRVARPRADLHRPHRRVAAGARVGGGVLNHERRSAQADQEVAETLLHRVLPVGDLRGIYPDARLPERAVLIDQRDEGTPAAGHRRREPGKIVEAAFRAGVQQPGRAHRRQAVRGRQLGRQPVGPHLERQDIRHTATVARRRRSPTCRPRAEPGDEPAAMITASTYQVGCPGGPG
jgi:hypothetical protein